jgi:DNA-binding FadR family transcriptional regulator
MSGNGTGTVSRRVHDSLRRQILEGELEPGDRIPSERVLAEEFGVNRHAVREALKRLQQAGLIRITHGGATRVLDWRDSGGLEVMLDLGGDPLDPPAEVVRSVLEMRASIGVDAARLCAGRATEAERRAIEQLGERAADLVGSGQDETLDLAFAEFWLAIVNGSGNIAYRLSLNSLLAAMTSFGDVADRVRARDAKIIVQLGRAISTGDPDAASEVAGRMLRADIDRAS